MKKFVAVSIVSALLVIAGTVKAHDGTSAQEKGPFTLKKLTDDVYVLYGRGGNIGFAVTPEGVVVIDDQFIELAPGIHDQIKSVTSQPVRFLINTHHHFDHTGGNAYFIKIATIIAHDNVRKHMLDQVQRTLETAPRRIESLQAEVAKLEKEPAQAEKLQVARRQLEETRRSLESARSVKLSDVPAPHITFNSEVRIHVGGKEAQVFHVKRGHTDGDSIIYFPQDRVVHMGDLFFHKIIPFIDAANGASTSEWIETIDAVVARVHPASQVIPGHGEVTTVEQLKAFKQYFTDLRAEVKKAVDAGKSKEEATREVKLAQYAGYNGYEQRFAMNVGVVYDELKR